MASTFSTNLNINEPATGDLVNTWGINNNNNFTIIDNAFGSSTTIALTNTSVTLTVAQAAYYNIILTGAITTNLQLILPGTIGGTRHIWNTTTGAYTVSVLNGSSDTGGGVVVPQGIIVPIVLTAGQAYYDNYQSVPPGTILHYAGGTAPPGFTFTTGASLSTTTYSLLFNAIGYTYGGSGSSFNIPDTRGIVLAAADNMGGSAAGRLTGYVLGTSGGSQNVALSTGQLPAHNHAITDPGHTHGHSDPGHAHAPSIGGNFLTSTGPGGPLAGGGSFNYGETGGTSTVTTGITNVSNTTGITTQNTGSGTAVGLLQPTLCVNHIIRY